eukprot:TRINITY_DN1034_c0_g2_i2.p1 TRINITY_DN1034_c0_g2~~TRINITY_DN1034_c0_g2_i2.p1  ORF type:complete len:133 (-),score=1.83 TRINITY_DN1034_c0_g2_i2:46-444(-)
MKDERKDSGNMAKWLDAMRSLPLFANNLTKLIPVLNGLSKDMAKHMVTKETGAGMVKVTMSGMGRLEQLKIDKVLLAKQDTAAIEAMIKKGVNDALEDLDLYRTDLLTKKGGELAGKLSPEDLEKLIPKKPK